MSGDEAEGARMSAPTHVYPLGDLIEHVLDDTTCVCGPRAQLVLTDHGDEWLIVHHSLDGREQQEETA